MATESAAAPERRSVGALQRARRQLYWPQDRDFRILSLDGGGIKGIYSAAFLARLESKILSGGKIGDYFDMVAGTSTGGIIAIGLSVGKSASDILDLYLRRGSEIFPRKALTGFIQPAFRPNRLRDLLSQVVGNKAIGESQIRLCIPSCEGRFGDVNIFKTPHHPDFKLDWKQRMSDVALATSAAPTFLPAHKIQEYIYVDGGLWANNPIMVALVDALSSYSVGRRQIKILTIGTGAKDPALALRHQKLGGWFSWVLTGDIIGSVMQFASLNADGQAGLLIGRDHIRRISPEGAIADVHMTDFYAAKNFMKPAAEATADSLATELRDMFFASPAERATFYHGPQATPDDPRWAEGD